MILLRCDVENCEEMVEQPLNGIPVPRGWAVLQLWIEVQKENPQLAGLQQITTATKRLLAAGGRDDLLQFADGILEGAELAFEDDEDNAKQRMVSAIICGRHVMPRVRVRPDTKEMVDYLG